MPRRIAFVSILIKVGGGGGHNQACPSPVPCRLSLLLPSWCRTPVAPQGRHPYTPVDAPPPRLQLVLLAVPLRLPPPSPVKRFLRFSMVAAGAYFPVKVVWEGKEEDYAEGPFVIGERIGGWGRWRGGGPGLCVGVLCPGRVWHVPGRQ